MRGGAGVCVATLVLLLAPRAVAEPPVVHPREDVGPAAAMPSSPAVLLDLPTPAAEACPSGVIHAAVVGRCPLPRCEDPEFRARVLALGDFLPGRPIDAARVDESRRRLSRLGFFKDVTVSCRSTPDGLDVTVDTVPTTRVRSVVVDGNEHFYDSIIVDRLTLQPGDALEPGDPVADELLDRIREAIRRMYQDDGYTGTKIVVTTAPAGVAEVDVMVRIEEGDRLRVESIEPTLHPSWSAPAPPAGLPAETCPAIHPHDLREWAEVSVGQSYNERTIPDAVRKLTRTLRVVGYSGVKVTGRFDLETKRLDLDAAYDSCYLLRFFVRDTEQPGRLGFRPVEDEGLLGVLPFGDSGVFDLTEAALGREQVRSWFESRGNLFADVVLDFRAREAGEVPPGAETTGRPWATDVSGVVSYFITKNARVEIRGVHFQGNSEIRDEDLENLISTKPYDFFGDAGIVLPEQIGYDLDRIERLYRYEGFRDMRFAGTLGTDVRLRESAIDGDDTLYTYHVGPGRVFRIRRLPLTEGVYVEIPIEEGRRELLGTVAVAPGSALTEEEALQTLALEPGGPFSSARVVEGVTRLVRRLSNNGYLAATVKVRCVGHDPEVPREQCVVEKVVAGRVDLDLEVVEGARTFVGAVFVDGTHRTEDSVVLREFPEPGEPYDVEKMAEAIRRLKDLGVFSSVQLTTVGADETPPRQDLGLVVNCREARSRFLDLSGGFETLDRDQTFPGYIASPMVTSLTLQDRSTNAFGRLPGLQIPDVLLTAEVRYTDENFLGRAKRLYLPFKYGLSATAWDRYASFTPTYVDPRFLMRGLTFRWTPFAIYDRATSRLDVLQFGTEFALSTEFVPRLFGAIAFQVATVKSRDTDVTGLYSPFRLESKVVPSLTYDRLDHPINPKRGGFVQASLSYINALSTLNGVNNFLKWEVTGKGYWTVRNLVTFALMVRYGASMSFGGQTKLPDEERFTLGGNRGVRGFSNDALGQYNSDGSPRLVAATNDQGVVTKQKPYGGDVVLAASAEIRFPIIRKLNLDGAVFYDLGALAERVTDLNRGSFRSSVGLGLRLLLGGTIPIRLDYGIILDRRCRDVDSLTGVCVQREEVGNIHFGILYTF